MPPCASKISSEQFSKPPSATVGMKLALWLLKLQMCGMVNGYENLRSRYCEYPRWHFEFLIAFCSGAIKFLPPIQTSINQMCFASSRLVRGVGGISRRGEGEILGILRTLRCFSIFLPFFS